jgi:hypothetical protein
MAAVPSNAFFVVYRSWHRRQVRVVPVVIFTGVYLLRVYLLLAILLPVSLLWGCSWWRQTQNWSSLGVFIKFRNGFNGLKKLKVKIFCQSPCKGATDHLVLLAKVTLESCNFFADEQYKEHFTIRYPYHTCLGILNFLKHQVGTVFEY